MLKDYVCVTDFRFSFKVNNVHNTLAVKTASALRLPICIDRPLFYIQQVDSSFTIIKVFARRLLERDETMNEKLVPAEV